MKPSRTGPKPSNAIVAAFMLVCALVTGAWAEDGAPGGVAMLIPGPPDCQLAAQDRRAAQQSGFDDVTQYCYLELSDVPQRTRQIAATRPKVLVVYASALAARAAHETEPALPLVFVDIPDPVADGLVASLAHPGGNVTGVTNNSDEALAKRIQLAKEAFPALTRLAALGNLANPGRAAYWRVVQNAGAASNVKTRLYEVRSPQQLAGAFDAMVQDGMEAVIVLPDAWFYPNRVEYVTLANSHRLFSIGGNLRYADLGQVLSYGASIDAMSQRAWEQVRKILNGAPAGDLPVEQPTNYEYILNVKSARALGLKLPPATMLRATRVIE